MASDEVRLIGVECRDIVGVPASERGRKQWIEVDVVLELDTAKAAAADDFRLAADYWAVEKAVRAAVETSERALLETLAEQAAAAALKAAPGAAAVRVVARKKPAVIRRER